MTPQGIGVNTRRTDGDIGKFAAQLDYLDEAGFDYIEVSADVVDTIAGGEIVTRKMQKLVELLDSYQFHRTAHIHNGIDLRDGADRDFQLKSFRSGIDFAREIGAEILVCHFEQESEDPAVEELFRDGISRMLDYAKRQGVQLGLENIEIDTLDKVVQFVRSVNDPGFSLVVDVGHAFLSETYFGNDFLAELRKAADIVDHLHLSDNFGRYDEMRLSDFDRYRAKSFTNRLILGRGDLNLPPGWGAMPFDEIIRILDGFEGVAVLEYYHDKYRDFNKEIVEETRERLHVARGVR